MNGLMIFRYRQRDVYKRQDPDWLHTFTNAKKIVNYFPDYLPNTYWQYYLLGDDIVDYMDINNTRGMQVIQMCIRDRCYL